jgi:hypothetical protein
MKQFSISEEEAALLLRNFCQAESSSQRKRIRLQPYNPGSIYPCLELKIDDLCCTCPAEMSSVQGPLNNTDRLQSSLTASSSESSVVWCTEKLLKGKKKLEVEVVRRVPPP